MRLLFGVTRAEQGGAQTHVAHLLDALGAGHELGLVTGEEDTLTEHARHAGIPIYIARHLVRAVNPVRDALAIGEVFRAIRSFGPDLVTLHSSKAGVVGRAAALLAGVPAVFTAHGWAFAEGVPAGRGALAVASERLAARWARRIIVVSDADRRLALRHRVGSPDRLVRVRCGLPDVEPRAAPGAWGEDGVVRVVMVARLAAPKEPGRVVRAVAGLGEGVRLLLAGDGPGRARVEAEARRLGVADRVELLGSRPDVPAILAGSHVFVLASRWEGLPLTIMEAMRAGLPVVASDVGGVAEAVGDGDTGFMVPRGDTAALRDALARLVADAALRARMGAAGRLRFEAEFTLERTVAETLTVYRAALDEESTS